MPHVKPINNNVKQTLSILDGITPNPNPNPYVVKRLPFFSARSQVPKNLPSDNDEEKLLANKGKN